jgi:transcriptional regulator with XRE-family HTH domain
MNNFGQRLRAIIANSRLCNREVAQRAGITQDTLYRMLRSETAEHFNVTTTRAVAAALNINEHDMVNGTEGKQEKSCGSIEEESFVRSAIADQFNPPEGHGINEAKWRDDVARSMKLSGCDWIETFMLLQATNTTSKAIEQLSLRCCAMCEAILIVRDRLKDIDVNEDSPGEIASDICFSL